MQRRINFLFLRIAALSFIASCTGHQQFRCSGDDIAYQAAARDNNVHEMDRLETGGTIDQEAFCLQDEPSLIQAVRTGAYEAFERLIGNDTDVDIQTAKTRVTALMVASQKGLKDFVKMLLKKEASINQKSKTGDTALLLAAKEDHTDIVKLLVEHKADSGISNKKGETPYSWAKHNNNKEMQRMLEIKVERAPAARRTNTASAEPEGFFKSCVNYLWENKEQAAFYAAVACTIYTSVKNNNGRDGLPIGDTNFNATFRPDSRGGAGIGLQWRSP